jgi:heme/copper-type cytochrome/quinol oxidase subunit 2
VRAAYLVMEPAARFVLLPFAIASLVTGLVQSLGTSWGLIRHYWVVFKLLITILATIILVVYMATFRVMAATAADMTAELDVVRNPSPVLHAVLALVALLSATVLAVFKPRGVTPYGREGQDMEGDGIPR